MTIKTVTDIDELHGIKLLQQLNLKSGISAEEAAMQGFLTAEYTVDFLKKMNNSTPAIVASTGGTIVGYALATIRETGGDHDLLNDLFKTIDALYYDGVQLKHVNYIVVGQLCVAKEYRGKGMVQALYNKFREVYCNTFRYCITDVAENNPRSLKAHIKSGFKAIDTLSYGGIGWNIVLWDWQAGVTS